MSIRVGLGGERDARKANGTSNPGEVPDTAASMGLAVAAKGHRELVSALDLALRRVPLVVALDHSTNSSSRLSSYARKARGPHVASETPELDDQRVSGSMTATLLHRLRERARIGHRAARMVVVQSGGSVLMRLIALPPQAELAPRSWLEVRCPVKRVEALLRRP
jgi:hypothetical protein